MVPPPYLSVAIQDVTGIEVWLQNKPDSNGIGIGSAPGPLLTSDCDPGGGPPPCPGPCHDTGDGIEPGAFAFAHTIEGHGWLAHVTTHRDRMISYAPDPQQDTVCRAQIDSDLSTATLHVSSVGWEGLTSIELFTLPVDPPAVDVLADGPDGVRASPRSIAARTFANSLAIGLRTRDPATHEIAVRVLQIETWMLDLL